MTFPLLAGDEVPASLWTSYTPQLLASSSNPTLGSGSTAVGRWIRDPITGLITAQGRFSFGNSGTNPGSGNYMVSMPTAISSFSVTASTGIADIIGTWTARDASNLANSRHGILGTSSNNGGTGGVGLATLFLLDGTNAIVTHTAPIAWDASDGIAFLAVYRGA